MPFPIGFRRLAAAAGHQALLLALLTCLLGACKVPARVAVPPATLPASLPAPAAEKENAIGRYFRESAVLQNNFTGFMLVDAHSRDTLYQQLADRYFIPASNMKLFTFYAATRILGDSVPGIKYLARQDSLIFWGTGDPTLFHPDLHGDRVFHFLKSRREKLYYSDVHHRITPFGPGWSWDNYNYYFSAERSPFPLYGNVLKFTFGGPGKVKISPALLKARVSRASTPNPGGEVVLRDYWQNQFRLFLRPNQGGRPVEVPFRQSAALQVQLLSDTLRRPVHYIRRWPGPEARTLYSFASDTLYRRMLQVSDNLLAEQLLALCAATLSDTLQPETAIRYARRHYFADLPDQPVWVDGSGLSRLNLVTPRSVTALLLRLYTEMPRQRLFSLLAAGGRHGTLRDAYQAEVPFLYAKTGSLTNNYNLSGYLLTRSGRTLIFAFMNNNYAVPTSAIRQEVERILTDIHLRY